MNLIEQIIFAALTESQMDKVLDMVASTLHAVREAIHTVWEMIAPVVTAYVGYLVYKILTNQKKNQEAVEEKITVAEAKVSAKVDANTMITKNAASAASRTHDAISDFTALREMTSLAKAVRSDEPVMYPITLPGPTYEKFELADGTEVLWRSEPCEQGKLVRYLIEGPCFIGWHFHEIAEIVTTVRGVLTYEVSGEKVTLEAGQSFSADADAIHSARFEAPGEALVHWPELTTDQLLIGIWPEVAPPSITP